MPLESKFVQQNQHWAFFFSGTNSLQTECTLSREDQDCDFIFEDSSHHKDKFTVLYNELAIHQSSLLHDLKNLYQTWQNESILTDVFGRISLTRANDLDALAQIIHELEVEPLQERVLMLRNDSRDMSAYFYSSSRAQKVYALFRKNLASRPVTPPPENNVQPSA